MVKKFCILFVCVFLFAGGGNLCAQQGEDYISKVKFDAAIYRGPTVLDYPFLFKGTCYAYSDEFYKSKVEYNKKWYYGVYLNLNAHTGELCLSLPGSGMAIVLSNELVGNFTLGDMNFTNLKSDAGKMEPGYYQVLYDGGEIKLYKGIEKKVNKRDGITNEFLESVKYWLYNGKEGVQVKSPYALGKLYKDKKVRKFIAEAKKGGMKGDQLMTAAIEFIDKQ